MTGERCLLECNPSCLFLREALVSFLGFLDSRRCDGAPFVLLQCHEWPGFSLDITTPSGHAQYTVERGHTFDRACLTDSMHSLYERGMVNRISYQHTNKSYTFIA